MVNDKNWESLIADKMALHPTTEVCTEENPVKRRKKIYNAKRHQRLKGTPKYEASRKATRHKCRDTDKYRAKHAGYMREWRKTHKENPEKHRERNKKYRERQKQKVLPRK